MNNGYKKTALALFALNHDDREWLLSELKEEQRDTIEKLMNELESVSTIKDNEQFEIGVLFDQRIYKKCGNFDPVLIASINDLDISQIVMVLKDEPVWVLSLILSCYKWSWQDKFYQKLDLVKRIRLFKYNKVKKQVLPDKVVNSLLISFEAAALKVSLNKKNNRFDYFLNKMKLGYA